MRHQNCSVTKESLQPEIWPLGPARPSTALSLLQGKTPLGTNLCNSWFSRTSQSSGSSKPNQEKLQSSRRREKHCKKRWLYKESQKLFHKNTYKVGKYLFQPNTSISLSTDKSNLDAYKSDCVYDKYNIPLSSLQGLPDKPPTTIPFPVKSLDFNDFLLLLGTRRNASAPGINAVWYKVCRKCPQLSCFWFNIFKSCLKHCVVPIQWRYAVTWITKFWLIGHK